MNHFVALMLVAVGSFAVAAPVTQYAVLKAVKVQGKVVTMSLDYVEVFSDTPKDAARAVDLGYFPDAETFYNSVPAGIYIRNVNSQLRTLKTDARTTFELSCMNAAASAVVSRSVPLNQFVGSWQGNSKPCWPFQERTVRLQLDGTRVLKVSQVYFP
ncbi:hypothetical protein K7W42_02050 [Deinococcus sp. HMF7604]|uniref:hypothetical protein n=1 Tax=Deinococcus betulae TaxID=2873312 RepID=UPI001CCA52A8|nr:hypothetical protein [Deinococcus betulae]MBZ9749639.1 hypothetical protein [Deinococcus betulae]